jgi:hypothetical protein
MPLLGPVLGFVPVVMDQFKDSVADFKFYESPDPAVH